MSLKEMIEEKTKIKELSDFKNPLFIGPHPDDIELGCGGLVSKLKEKGATIHFLVVTDGAAGTDDPALPPIKLKEIREKEATLSAKFLGAQTIDFIGLEDGGIFEAEDVTRLVSPYVLKYMPDIIFVPSPYLKSECHSDHLKVGFGVRGLMQIIGYPEALRRHHINVDGITKFPREITLAYYFTDTPNTYTELSNKNIDDQLKALDYHESQMIYEEMKMLVEYFVDKAKNDGKVINKEFAEAFDVLVPLCQHVFFKK